MIKFQTNSIYPRNILNKKIHIISTRNTMYGIHVPISPNNDLTKTHLISFINYNDAVKFKKQIDDFQLNFKKLPDRIIDDSENKYREFGVLLNLDIAEKKTIELETICDIYWFNLFVVYNINTTSNEYECYLYESQYPDNKLLSTFLNKIIYL